MPDRKISNHYLGVTAANAVGIMTDALRCGGIEGPAIDARLLVPAALGIAKQDLILDPQRPVASREASTLLEFEARRLVHEPVSRILGERAFYGRRFEITQATLDPRPDSETLVDASLEIAATRGWRDKPVRILDIGTGTGCLLLTLLAELPLATGTGTDTSAEALDVARRNAQHLGLAGRAQWSLTRSADGLSGRYDLVVSNPPYIPTGDIAGLSPDVRLYDPLAALDGGPDGLEIYREILASLARGLSFETLLLEIGSGQAGDVEALLRQSVRAAPGEVRSWQDLGGHTRCVALVTQ